MRTLFEAADESGDGFIAPWLFEHLPIPSWTVHLLVTCYARWLVSGGATIVLLIFIVTAFHFGFGPMLHDTLAEDRSEFVEIMNIPEVRRADLTWFDGITEVVGSLDLRSEQRMTENDREWQRSKKKMKTSKLALFTPPGRGWQLKSFQFKLLGSTGNGSNGCPKMRELVSSCFPWPWLWEGVVSGLAYRSRMVNLLKLTDSPGGPCPAMPSPASPFGIFRYHSVTSLSSDAHRRQLCRLRTQTFCLICLTTVMQNSPQCLGWLEREKVWKSGKGSPSSFLVPERSLFEHRIQHHFIFW